MPQFKLRPEAYKEMRNKSLKRIIPPAVIMLVAVSVINTINLKDREIAFKTIAVLVVVFILLFGFRLSRVFKKLKLLLHTYRITLNDSSITRTQQNTPPLTIYFNDIKEVIKYGNGNICIKGQKRDDTIIVFAQLEDFFQFENAIGKIKPIIFKSSSPFFQNYTVL